LDIRFIAKQYIDAGWAVVPLAPGLKKAESSWTTKGYGPADFGPDDGIAGKCGEPSGWRVDVDCDHPHAVTAAGLLLPTTGLVHGRPGKPASHYWYHCVGAQTTKFTDIKSTDAQGKSRQDTLIEIRSSPGHYTMLPPSVWTDKHDASHTEVARWELERDMLTLSPDDLYVAVRDVAIATLLAIHWPGGSVKHDMIGPLTGLLCQGGMDSTKVVEVIRVAATIAQDSDVRDRVNYAQTTVGKFRAGEKITGGPKLAEYLDTAVIAKIRGYLKLADLDALEEMNQKHFIVRMGKDEVIGTEEGDRVVFQYERALNLRYRNKTVQTGVDKEGAPTFAPLLETWLKSPTRREYREITFAPPPRTAVDRDYNLWRGLAVQPAPGDCSKFLWHLQEIICAGNAEHAQYLCKLLAFTVQQPGIPSGIATVLRGEEGTGKGIFIRAIGEIFGSHYAHLDNTQDMTGFNALMSGKVVVFADEAFWAGDKAHVGALKRIISEPTIRITRKNIDSYTEPNCLHLFIASNNEWVIPAEFRARRFFALKVSEAKLGDFAYFAEVLDELKNGGLAAFLDLLLKLPVTHDDILRVPRTEELRVQQNQSLPPELRWMKECLNEGAIGSFVWDEFIPCSDAFDAYRNWCREIGARMLDKIEFGRRMNKYLSAYKSSSRRVSGEIRRCWTLRTLEDARKFFDEKLGTKDEWDDAGSASHQPPLI